MPNVVLVMIDGLRPDAMDHIELPGLRELLDRGAYTLNASSVTPSITLPCHMSIFHSVPPSRHGILSNEYTPQVRPVRGLIEHLNSAGRRSAFFTNWEELRDLSRPSNLQMSWYANESYNLATGDALVVDAALPYISRAAFDFSFVYLGTVDSAGHAFGWMSEEYLQQTQLVDAQLVRIIDALPPDTVIICHADHGGHERTHGTEMPEDMTIPWVCAGAGIPHQVISESVSLLDTAPTIAALLSVQPWKEWEGHSIIA